MDLLNATIIHRDGSEGTVIKQEGHYITVLFSNEKSMKFIFPDSFEKFISAKDISLAAEISEILNLKAEQEKLKLEAKVKAKISSDKPNNSIKSNSNNRVYDKSLYTNLNKASDVIRSKLVEIGGTATIQTLQGNGFNISITSDGYGFETVKLPNYIYGFDVFDVIVDLLLENNGKAKKGNGRNNKLGQPGCEIDTVVGAIAYRYAGKTLGESVFDPVFVLAAIMEWAKICHNERGYLLLRPF